ncbi:hypothetical protein [Nibrella viscosa]
MNPETSRLDFLRATSLSLAGLSGLQSTANQPLCRPSHQQQTKTG